MTLIPSTTQIRVNADTAGSQARSVLSALPDGGAIVVWDDNRGGSSGAYFRRVDADGTPVGGNIEVLTGLAASSEPDVVALSGGGWAISVLANFVGSGLDSRIYVYDADGMPVGGDDNYVLLPSAVRVDLTPLPDGGFAASWLRSSGNDSFFVQRFEADGTAIGTPFVAVGDEGSDAQTPDIETLPDGTLGVIWSDFGGAPANKVYVARFGSDGVQAVSSEVVNDATGNTGDRNPDIEVLTDGRLVATWMSNGGLGGIEARILDSLAQPEGPIITVVDDSVGFATLPQVVALPDGEFAVIWSQGSNDSATIVGQRYDADGSPVGGQATIAAADDMGRPGINSAELLSDGTIRVTYTLNSAGSGPFDQDILTTTVALGEATAGPTAGPDALTGTDGDDVIAGADGNDTIDGNAGNDTLGGDGGDDLVSGSDGNDVVDGGAGADRLSGADGNDEVNGGAGNDNMGGGPGDDTMDGGAGNDTMGGGLDNDSMTGGDGNDIVNGGPGDDFTVGGGGDDTMGASFGNDTVDGGDGNDSLGGGTGRDSLIGGAGNDSAGGGEGNDTVRGEDGDDFLAGGGRDDNIDGGSGDDTMNGGDGDDTMNGGAGADVFVFNFFKDGDADVITDFEDGTDSILIRIVNPETGEVNISNGGNGLQGYVDALNITDTEEGALIDYERHTVLIEGVAATDLTVDDFTFL